MLLPSNRPPQTRDSLVHGLPGSRRTSILPRDCRTRVNGFEPERNPITQARVVRDWVGNLLHETTAKRYPVKGVVVLPGWYVSGPQDRSDIWVLNNKALLQFIERERCVVKDEDVALAYSPLSNYVVR